MSPSQDAQIIFESDKSIEGLEDLSRIMAWISEVVKREDRQIERIAFFFVSDVALLEMNKEFLNHDDLTDILTFPYSYEPIAADIYISYDRIVDNAVTHNCRVNQELRRVIIHGVLHMCGWTDKTEDDNAAMHAQEDKCLALWSAMS